MAAEMKVEIAAVITTTTKPLFLLAIMLLFFFNVGTLPCLQAFAELNYTIVIVQTNYSAVKQIIEGAVSEN